MIKALQEACVLQKLLAKNISRANLARQFYKKTKPYIKSAWDTQNVEDFLMHQTTYDKPKSFIIRQRYADWIVKAASHNYRIARAFWLVGGLEKSPLSMIAPFVVLHVLFDHFIRERWLHSGKVNCLQKKE